MRTEIEVLEELRSQCDRPAQFELLDELEAVLKADALWPLPVRVAAEESFGGGIHNPKGRDHASIDRRVRHALKVWRNRYSMNPEQMVYAGDVLAAALRRGVRDAGQDTGKRRAFALSNMEKAVNHDAVHEGFKKRAGHVNVSSQLEQIGVS